MRAGWEDEGGASGSPWPTVDGGRGDYRVAALTHLGRLDDSPNTVSVRDVASSDEIAADRAEQHLPSRTRRVSVQHTRGDMADAQSPRPRPSLSQSIVDRLRGGIMSHKPAKRKDAKLLADCRAAEWPLRFSDDYLHDSTMRPCSDDKSAAPTGGSCLCSIPCDTLAITILHNHPS